jgi:hypothetical protein
MTTLPFLLIIGMGNGCLPSRSPLSSCSGNFRGSFRTTAMATTIMRSQVWCWNVRTAQVPTLNLQNCATPELSSSRRYILKTLANLRCFVGGCHVLEFGYDGDESLWLGSGPEGSRRRALSTGPCSWRRKHVS